MTLSAHTDEMVQRAAQAALAKDAFDLVAIDVSGRFPFGEAFLIATGAVERTVQAIADSIEDAMITSGVKTLRREGRESGRWVLLDFGDLLVHVFHPEERDFYEIERLWNDCPIIEIAESHAGLQEAPEVR